MSKMLNCAMVLKDVIAAATGRPALAILRPELGHLGVGALADISILDVEDAAFLFSGVRGIMRTADCLLQPVAVYAGGKPSELSRRPF